MSSSSQSLLSRPKPKRAARSGSSRRHYLEFLEARQLLSGAPAVPPIQTYYAPFPAASVLQALQTIHAGPKSPISTYLSIAIAEDGTRIYYDQWENGFASDIAAPTGTEVYNNLTNPAGVQIWGTATLPTAQRPATPVTCCTRAT